MYTRQCPTGSIPYTIKPGDTLYRLALQYNSSVQAILTANPGMDPLMNIDMRVWTDFSRLLLHLVKAWNRFAIVRHIMF